MLDATGPFPILERAQGRAAVTLGPGPGGARLERLAQQGAAKAFLPRVHGPAPEVVFLNTAGGLTGGDRLSYALTLGPGARAVAATQTAERGYASAGGRAELRVDLRLAAGAALDWLPQETILFDRAALDRCTSADLGAGARLLFCEMIVLGRAAMGETVRCLDLVDRREVRRDGLPVLVEPLRLTAAALAAGPAATGAARALATIALVAPGAEDALDAARDALPGDVEAAASAWDGKCVIRLTAGDAAPLKRAAASVLTRLRGRPLPRVWQL